MQIHILQRFASKLDNQWPPLMQLQAGNNTIGLGHIAREKTAKGIKRNSLRKTPEKKEAKEDTMFDNVNNRYATLKKC